MQAEIKSAHAIRFENTAFGHGKLIDFEHPDLAELLLDHSAKRLQVDAYGQAYHHGSQGGSIASELGEYNNGQRTKNRGPRPLWYTPRYRAELNGPMTAQKSLKPL
jgi:hypothetical protein